MKDRYLILGLSPIDNRWSPFCEVEGYMKAIEQYSNALRFYDRVIVTQILKDTINDKSGTVK